MANVKITALPQQTTATDLDLLVVVNSGGTTTSKITRQDLLSGTTAFIQGDASQSIVPYYFPTSSGVTTDTTYVDKLNAVGEMVTIGDGTNTNTITDLGGYHGTILMGTSNTVNGGGTRGAIILGDSNNVSPGSGAPGDNGNIVVGDNNNLTNAFSNTTLVVGSSNTMAHTRSIIVGDNNSVTNGGNNAIFSESSTITGGQSAAFGAYNNLTGNYQYAMGQDNDITAGSHNSALGGTAHDITSSGSYNAIVGGTTNVISGTQSQSGIFVGAGNNINGLNSAMLGTQNSNIQGNYHTIIGGQYHDISGSNFGLILGGYDNDLTGSGNAAVIIGGEQNDITSSGVYSTISASVNGSIGGSITGAHLTASNGKAAIYDYTLHAENNHTFKTETFDTISGGTVGGSVDIDLSLGTIYKFTMSANTTPNFTNWREGQRIEIVVVNSGSYTVPTATITGGGSVYAKNGSLNPTNSGITKYKGVIVDGDMYLNEELNFQAV